MNSGPKSAVQLGNFRGVGQALGKPARWNLEIHAAEGGKSLAESSAEASALPGPGRVGHEFGQDLASFGFHGAAVEGGADLQPALDRFVEFADDDGGHEKMLAREC